jgi:phosphate-selective porin OprO/OprP
MYRSGAFRGVTPNNNFRPGAGWGAWQVGLRWSQFDASDLAAGGLGSGFVSGGRCASGSACSRQNDKVDSYGIGVNWILNPLSRVMFEWTRTDFGGLTTPTGTVGGVKAENVFSIRTQVMF